MRRKYLVVILEIKRKWKDKQESYFKGECEMLFYQQFYLQSEGDDAVEVFNC